MTTPEKAAAAISRLVRATTEGRLVWTRPLSTSGLGGPDDRVLTAYETTHNDRRLVLFVTRRPAWYDPDSEHQHYADVPQLAVLEPDGSTGWVFPTRAGVDDLLDVVQYQSAGVDEFLDGLLKAG